MTPQTRLRRSAADGNAGDGPAAGADPPPDGPLAVADDGDGIAAAAGDDVAAALSEAFARELAEARRTADENHDLYVRAVAEMQTVRRRAEERLQGQVEHMRRELLLRFLDVADNLERALKHADGDPAALAAGVDATYRDLERLLAREGVERIAAADAPFDPALHEATGAVPMPGLTAEQVVAVERAGYTVRGELLRPARVVVGQPAGD